MTLMRAGCGGVMSASNFNCESVMEAALFLGRKDVLIVLCVTPEHFVLYFNKDKSSFS